MYCIYCTHFVVYSIIWYFYTTYNTDKYTVIGMNTEETITSKTGLLSNKQRVDMVSGLVSVEEDETLGSLNGNAGRQADRWTT